MAIHSGTHRNLRNALTFERVLQRPTSSPKSSVDNQLAENATPNQSVTAVAPGSWACVRRGQPNEEPDYESKCRCQECPSDDRDSSSLVYLILSQKQRKTSTLELELELIQTQMAQKPMLRAEVGMRVRCANKSSAE